MVRKAERRPCHALPFNYPHVPAAAELCGPSTGDQTFKSVARRIDPITGWFPKREDSSYPLLESVEKRTNVASVSHAFKPGPVVSPGSLQS